MAEFGDMERKWDSIAPLLCRPGPYMQEGFEGDEENIQSLQETRILVVGAGGLGCEILKDLALSGFVDIHLIDLDTIDVSNLNRQFLFRMKDVGRPKAQVAAEFIMRKRPAVDVKWHSTPIQEFPKAWYKKFDLVIAGLDNVAARSWLNETLVDLVKYDTSGEPDEDTVIPLIDGGTEGFNGQSRIFLPHTTSCFECSLSSMAETNTFPMCTIANVPRIPEHCIAYALKVAWRTLEVLRTASDYKVYTPIDAGDAFKPDGVTLDNDNVEHVSWLYYAALKRAEEFGIEGVTYSLTMQVAKNIIPAIASTNALISAACVNEAFKYLSGTSQRLNNYMMYMGGKTSGIHSDVFNYGRNVACRVCHRFLLCQVDPMSPFQDFVTALETQGSSTPGWSGPHPNGLGAIQSLANQLTNASILLRNAKGELAIGAEFLTRSVGEVLATKDLLSATDRTGTVQKILVLFKSAAF
jgi:ubiquitin-activating enzyme E1 C